MRKNASTKIIERALKMFLICQSPDPTLLMRLNSSRLWPMFVFLFLFCCAPAIKAEDRALLVGVEKYADERVPQTPGCVADAEKTRDFLIARFGFKPDSVKVLRNEEATAGNIEQTFRAWLIDGTQPGDRVFFLYAGHGSQLADDNGDEAQRDPNDKLDETLAPFDVNPETGANEIRDDLFDELIGKLSGRRAALVFDSCHSGTISRGVPLLKNFPRGGGARYLPRPEQFRALQPAPGAKGIPDGYVVGSVAARDLKHEEPFVDPQKIGQLSGVVIISAARDNQRAYPLEVDGVYRGALSYLFAEAQKDSLPTFRALQTKITERINELHSSGKLDGNQQPVFEEFSTVPLADQPLFATWEQAPAVALTNPLSPIRLSLRMADGKTVYREGEKEIYEVTTDTGGFLYLVAFSQNNVATCIFPNETDRDNQVSAGTHKFPRTSAYDFTVGEPFGRDAMVAILSRERLNIGDRDEYTWQEIFARLNLRGLQEQVGRMTARGVKSQKASAMSMSDWQGATLVVETKK